MDFTVMDLNTVAHGKTGGGVRYLELFLREYTALFNETVNPGCNRCLNTYLTKYKNHVTQMANKCKYRLHARYENIPLEFGSPVLVNNSNITDEYAQVLLKKPGGKKYFDILPAIKIQVIDTNLRKMKRTRIANKFPKRSPDAENIPEDSNA